MKISWNWLSELIDLSGQTPQSLAELLTLRGLEVEEVHALAKGFERVITAQILERNKHPDSDRLSLCKVTLGSGEPLEIVCGAQNMKAGDKVALAQIGADLPNGVKIERSKIRGVFSNGMLCSEEELKLADESEGIMILPPDTPLGKPLARVLGLDDTILTFKLTANRGDCLSHFGMAREVGAALGRKPKAPPAAKVTYGRSPIEIALEVGEEAPQFYGVYIEGVKIGPSPDWVVKKLEAVGSRSINNVVDATNLLMLELGHPVHAYDAKRIEGSRIGVRMAKKGEALPLLDGSQVTLDGSELVIFDAKRAVGLAGVMGGGNSEVSDATTSIFLECAEFAPTLVRKASSRHLKKTEAAHRFERGIDPNGLSYAMGRLTELVTSLAGGKVQGASIAALPSRKNGAPARRITVSPKYFSELLGMNLNENEIKTVLAHHDCVVAVSGPEWTVTAPSYRLDLNLKEDLAEEVARSLGYDHIPSTIPPLTSMPEPEKPDALRMAKSSLARMGLLESIGFAFTSQAWLSKFGMLSSLKLVNPLSEEYEALVPSLLPGLIKNVLDNSRHHFGSEALPARLFEIRPTYHLAESAISAQGEMATGVIEKWKIAFVLSGPRFAQALRNEQGEVDFYDTKAVAEALFEDLGTRGIRIQPLTQGRNASREGAAASRQGQQPAKTGELSLASLFHPGQSVEIWTGNQPAGILGLLHPGLAKELKTRGPIWMAELDWDAILALSRAASSKAFKPWPAFPPMERDFALLVKSDVTADKLVQLALRAGKPNAKVAKVFDIYRGSQVPEGMTSVAVRVIFWNEGRSLQESETEAASSQILAAWKKDLGAELRA